MHTQNRHSNISALFWAFLISTVDTPFATCMLYTSSVPRHKDHAMSTLQPRTRESLLRFLESAALQRDPPDTFGQRLVLLRLVFSTGAASARDCIHLLEQHGVLIAAYDQNIAARYHSKKVTTMEHEEWSDVYACLEHAGVTDILAALGEEHGENLSDSPVQRVREALEREVGGAPCAPLLVQTFLALYNIEADRKALLETILQKYQVKPCVCVLFLRLHSRLRQ